MTENGLVNDTLLQSVLHSAARAREQSIAILDLITSLNTPHDDLEMEQRLALCKQQKILAVQLTQLRSLNRKAILNARSTKQETTSARQEVDSLHLELQNLYYEQRHLRGEINACENYEHTYTAIGMTTVDEFLRSHPEFSDADEHALTVARIEDEHVQRTALEEERLGLLRRKESLVKETTAKREELGALDAEMEKWITAETGVRRLFEARESRVLEASGTEENRG